MTILTSWLSRIAWILRGRRNVRVQLTTGEAVDGIFTGKIAGHYRLSNAKFYSKETPSIGEEMLGETWIPQDRVFLLNVR